MVMTMIELHEDHSIALPHGGLISKILKAKLPQIDGNEPMHIPEGYFGKGTVMMSNAQLQRFQALRDPTPQIIPDPQASFSSGSSSSDVMTQLNVITGLLQAQGQSIEAINKWPGDMEKDVEQVKNNVKTALLHLPPEDQRHLVP